MTGSAGDGDRNRLADVLCVAALMVGQGWAVLSITLVPSWLGTRPVALEAVNGGILSVIAAGAFVHAGRASLAAAWAAPMVLWPAIDAVSWWAGRRFGARALGWLTQLYPDSKLLVGRSERFFDRHRIAAVALAPWLPVPAALVYAVSGWRRLPWPMFVGADVAGTLVRNGLILWAGYSVGTEGVRLAQRETQLASWLTGTIVVFLLVSLSAQALRRRRSAMGTQLVFSSSPSSLRASAATVKATKAHYEAFPFVTGGPRRVQHWTRRLRQPLPDEVLLQGPVLDVGCGSGEITRSLRERRARTVSVDLTRAAATNTLQLSLGAPVCQASALELPFSDSAFAHSVAIGVLHHTPDAARGLREMTRVTRPGGRIVLLLYARWTPYHAIYLLAAPLRARISVRELDRAPRLVLAIMRLMVAAQVRQRLPDTQLRRLLADQLWTPQASFHSWRQINRWADQLELTAIWRKRLFCHANLVALQRK
ncbi:MAG TPA: methyltransferase domain-containing protein [Streptosporangiaceae bacterium]|nr:methyltransferase domain-containing protein [Streptosporangiaceae bacterium]HVB45678.1 methyltransferase domain-containing protein [Streptosporangiaceae bacterium]